MKVPHHDHHASRRGSFLYAHLFLNSYEMVMHVRIIWDFFGPDAKGTAKHQIHHVHELFERESITYYASGVGTAQKNHAMSWVEIDLEEEEPVSKALKPNRRATEPNFDKIEWDWPTG